MHVIRPIQRPPDSAELRQQCIANGLPTGLPTHAFTFLSAAVFASGKREPQERKQHEKARNNLIHASHVPGYSLQWLQVPSKQSKWEDYLPSTPSIASHSLQLPYLESAPKGSKRCPVPSKQDSMDMCEIKLGKRPKIGANAATDAGLPVLHKSSVGTQVLDTTQSENQEALRL